MKKFQFLILFLLFSTNLFGAKNLYLSYKNAPKKVYENQRFSITIKALITSEKYKKLETSFSDMKNITLLNPENLWKLTSKNTYENTYYFKIYGTDFTFPKIIVTLLDNNDNIIDKSSLQLKSIKFSKIASGDKRFSKVIAKELTLKAYKTKQYNNKEALTIIDMEAKNSNLEDFKIPGLKEQDKKEIIDNFSSQNLIYYFVTKVQKKKIVVTYYNTTLNRLQELTIPLILQNELVSTQTDLNPNDSTFETYKKILFICLFFIFLILYLMKKKRILLIITSILFIISVIYLKPNQKKIIKKNSYIYILPTKNSTIFFKLNKDEEVEILQKKQNFLKVLGTNKKFIGWVKEERLEEN